jgi:hypothetical protein
VVGCREDADKDVRRRGQCEENAVTATRDGRSDKGEDQEANSTCEQHRRQTGRVGQTVQLRDVEQPPIHRVADDAQVVCRQQSLDEEERDYPHEGRDQGNTNGSPPRRCVEPLLVGFDLRHDAGGRRRTRDRPHEVVVGDCLGPL